MAGIYGIWDLQNRESFPADSKILRAAAAQGFGHPWHEIHSASNALLFGSAMPQLYSYTVWPVESKDHNYALVIQGEIYLQNGKVLDENNWEVEFLPQFRNDPGSFLSTLDGAFVLAVFDSIRKKLFLASDRFGNFALHYQNTPKSFAFATQMSGLPRLSNSFDLDEKGVAQFLGLGYTLNGKTQFAHVNRLAAASMLIFDGSQITIEEYYRPHYSATSPSIQNKKLLIEEFAEIFSQSVRSRTHRSGEAGHPVAAALSGGFDSRLTWAAICNIGKSSEVVAFTLGLRNSRDIELSGRIVSKLGIHRLPHYFDSDFLKKTPDFWNTTVGLTEGGLGIESTTTVEAWHAQQHEYNLLLDSYGGALYRRQYMRLQYKKFSDLESYGETMFELSRSPLSRSDLLMPDVRKRIRQESVAALSPFFEHSGSIGSIGDQLDVFYFTQLSANRNALSNNAQLNFLGLHYPLCTAKAHELVQNIPDSLRKQNWVHSEVIRLLAPELTRFPIDNQGMWGPYRGFSYFRYLGMGYEVLLKKAKPILGDQLSKKLSFRRPLTDQDSIMRLNTARFREQLLDLRPQYQAYCNTEKVEQYVKNLAESTQNRQFRAPSLTNLSSLQQLLSFALWLQNIPK